MYLIFYKFDVARAADGFLQTEVKQLHTKTKIFDP